METDELGHRKPGDVFANQSASSDVRAIGRQRQFAVTVAGETALSAQPYFTNRELVAAATKAYPGRLDGTVATRRFSVVAFTGWRW